MNLEVRLIYVYLFILAIIVTKPGLFKIFQQTGPTNDRQRASEKIREIGMLLLTLDERNAQDFDDRLNRAGVSLVIISKLFCIVRESERLREVRLF